MRIQLPQFIASRSTHKAWWHSEELEAALFCAGRRAAVLFCHGQSMFLYLFIAFAFCWLGGRHRCGWVDILFLFYFISLYFFWLHCRPAGIVQRSAWRGQLGRVLVLRGPHHVPKVLL